MPMLPANAHAHGLVLSISPITTARPASGMSQPRSGPSSRINRNTRSAAIPIIQGIQEKPANGHNSSAATTMARQAAPRGERVSRRQSNRGRGGGAPDPGGSPGGGPGGIGTGGGGTGRAAGSNGGPGSRRGFIATGGYWFSATAQLRRARAEAATRRSDLALTECSELLNDLVWVPPGMTACGHILRLQDPVSVVPLQGPLGQPDDLHPCGTDRARRSTGPAQGPAPRERPPGTGPTRPH